jgi:Zn-finger nucleic acid-binding protein
LPLFLCPNDNDHMQKVTRDGVELDICPTCRGVWLDRGELEKLLTVQKSDADEQQRAEARFQREVSDFHRDPDDWRKRHPYDEREKRYKYDDDDDHDGQYGRRKRKRGFDFFDIFD